MKIRLHGTGEECREVAERLMRTPGLTVVAVSAPYPDRGASVLVRVYVEARLSTLLVEPWRPADGYVPPALPAGGAS